MRKIKKQTVAFFLIVLMVNAASESAAKASKTSQVIDDANTNTELAMLEVLDGTLEVECVQYSLMGGLSILIDRYFVTQTDRNNNENRVYLAGSVDFAKLVGKEIVLYGQTKQSLVAEELSQEIPEAFFVTNVVVKSKDEPSDNVLILPPPTVGNRTVLVMPIQFTTLPQQYTPAQYNQWIFTGFGTSVFTSFNSIKDYYQKVFKGFNLVGVNNFNGDVTSTITLDVPTDNCSQNIGNTWRQLADDAAEAQGFSKLMYLTRIYLFPSIPGCSSSASATQGVLGNTTTVRHVFLQTPSSGNFDNLVRSITSTAIHEIGHTIGFVHAEGGGFTTNDEVDPMGRGMTNFHNINLLKAGVLTMDDFYPILQYRGTYTMYIQSPLGFAKRGLGPNSPAVGVIIESRDSSGNLSPKHGFIEARINVGIDKLYGTSANLFSYGPTYRTVNIDLTSFDSKSELIDSTSGTPCCQDAPIVPDSSGTRTWTYPTDGVTVKVWTANRRWTRIEVTLDNRYPTPLNVQKLRETYPDYEPFGKKTDEQ